MPRNPKDENLLDAENTLPRGQAMREFAEWANGGPLPPGQIVPEEFRITDRLIQRMVVHSLATLYALADRGHFKAAQYIVQLGLGSTEKPFSEQVQNLEREDARQKLFELYRKKGLSEETAWKMVDAKRSQAALPARKEEA